MGTPKVRSFTWPMGIDCGVGGGIPRLKTSTLLDPGLATARISKLSTHRRPLVRRSSRWIPQSLQFSSPAHQSRKEHTNGDRTFPGMIGEKRERISTAMTGPPKEPMTDGSCAAA
eukprot:scaffold731_cov261-Pinguiococcus_pyrenoidosus.AAC.101